MVSLLHTRVDRFTLLPFCATFIAVSIARGLKRDLLLIELRKNCVAANPWFLVLSSGSFDRAAAPTLHQGIQVRMKSTPLKWCLTFFKSSVCLFVLFCYCGWIKNLKILSWCFVNAELMWIWFKLAASLDCWDAITLYCSATWRTPSTTQETSLFFNEIHAAFNCL